MNKEVLEKALAMMEHSENFTMADMFLGGRPCGTPCCIAGHIIAAAGHIPEEDSGRVTSVFDAARLAEIDDDQRIVLFTPIAGHSGGYWFDADIPEEEGHITKEHAMACLRKFIDTGEIDWAGTAPKGGSDENC